MAGWALLSLLEVGVPGSAAGAAPEALSPITRWSFEAGLPPDFSVRFRARNGYADEPGIEWLDPRPRLDGDAAIGKRSLALPIPVRGRVLLHTPLVPAGPSPSVFSVYLRAEAPSRAVLRLFESVITGGKAYGARMRELGAKEVPVTTAWTRVMLVARGEKLVFGEIEAAGPGTLLVDGIEIGASDPPAAFAPPVELVATVEEDAGRVRGVLAPGEPVRVSVSLSRPPLPSERLLVTVTNPRDQPVRLVREKSPPGASSVVFVTRPNLLGPYRVRATLIGSGNTVVAWGERAFSIIAPPPARGEAESFLGTHTRIDARHLAIAGRLGFRWLRLHDASMIGQWITVEPEPGKLHYFDEPIDYAHRAGFSLLGVLEATPRWASSAPEGMGWYEARSFPPRDPAAWESYVRNTALHYRGRIDSWEVWNEPYLPDFWRGTPEQYGALLDQTVRAVSAAPGTACPRLLASGAAEGKRREWTRTALCAGRAPCDRFVGMANKLAAVTKDGQAAVSSDGIEGAAMGLAFHPYDPRLVEKLDRGDAVGERAAVFQQLTGGPPLWATEGTVLGASESILTPPAPLPSPRIERDAEAIAGWAADLLAAGAVHVFVYQLVESGYRSDADLALLDPDGTPRPAAIGLATLGSALGPRRFTRTIAAAGFTAHLFGAPGKPAMAVIASRDPAPLPIKDARRFRDVFGNPLLAGMRPRFAYLEIAEGEDAEALLGKLISN